MPEEVYLIKCPHCKKESKLNNALLKRLRVYLERFKNDFEKIKSLSNGLDVKFIMDKILKEVD